VAEFIHAQFQLPAQMQAVHSVASGEIEAPPDSVETLQLGGTDEDQEPQAAPPEAFSQPQSQEPPPQDTGPVRNDHPPTSPPIEIRPISPPHSREAEEFTRSTSDQNSPETGHAGF
ncbi:MAG: hypothetical protein AAB403_00260, partial [Planctomycetota bacterium]